MLLELGLYLFQKEPSDGGWGSFLWYVKATKPDHFPLSLAERLHLMLVNKGAI